MRGRAGYRAGLGATGPLPIVFVSYSQINAQMPEFPGTGPVSFTVLLNPESHLISSPSLQATFNSLLEPFAPAFFVFPNSMSIAAEEAGT